MSSASNMLYICFFCTILSLSLGQRMSRTNNNRRFPPSVETKNNNVNLNCTTVFTDEIIQLIIDYALWRNVAMLYIIDESINSGCNMKTVRQKLDCFSENGLSIAMQRRFHGELKPSVQSIRILIISFIRANTDFDKYLEQVNRFAHERFKWLNIYSATGRAGTTAQRLFDRLKRGALTLWSDVVVVVTTANSTKTDQMPLRSCKRSKPNLKSYKKVHVEMLLPFNDGRNKSVTFEELCQLSNSKVHEKSSCVLQVYKIRKSNNASLVVRPLGYWNYKTGIDGLKPHQSIEERINFHGFPLIFGKKRFSQELNIVSDESIIEDDNDEENMEKISEFISSYLNATPQVKMYTTLGLKGPSGNWSGLLGAVVAQDVDIGLDSVIEVPERYNDMAFTQNIMRSVRNIYLKPEESHNARDLFAAPFEPGLALSTLGTSLIFSVAMALYILKNGRNFDANVHDNNANANSCFNAFSDGIVWVIGVCTMQGTIIQPRSPSGNFIIVISLLYAVILYNSYSAFITSVLSVKLVQIRSVEDLLDSDYDIGYAKNSQDEIFLRSMNKTHLNQIYLRGYLQNNINNVTDGLLKATKGNYGFFAAEQVARKQFLKISGYKCKYDIMEIAVPSTRNAIAFPMSLQSPYRKVINYCLMKMAEAGIHQYIISQIAPQLPKCDQLSSYQSVRINDLTTLYGLLLIGLSAGSAVLLLEYLWKKRRMIYFKLRGNRNGHSFAFTR